MHVSDHELELYARGQLSRSDSSIFEAHLAECDACKKRLTETEIFVKQLARLSAQQQPGGTAKDRRREPRVPTDDPASLHVLDPLSPVRSAIRILDVSKSGLKLYVPEFLQKGTIVQIRLRDSVILGEVRYCRAMDKGFQVGVSLHDVLQNPHAT